MFTSMTASAGRGRAPYQAALGLDHEKRAVVF